MLKKLALCLFVSISIIACDSNDDNTVSQVPQTFPSGGSIRGTVEGITSDGLPFTATFDHRFYQYPDQLYSYLNPFGADFYYATISRIATGNYPVGGGSELSFSLLSPIQPFGIEDFRFGCDFLANLSDGRTLNFWSDFDNSGISASTVNVTSFTYNQNTRISSGTFELLLDGSDNSTGNTAFITASFQSMPMLLTTSKAISGDKAPVFQEK